MFSLFSCVRHNIFFLFRFCLVASVSTIRMNECVVLFVFEQVFFRVSMAILHLSKEHLMMMDFDGTIK